MHHKKVYKALAKDELFLAWLRKPQEVHTCDYSVYLLIYRISLSDDEDGPPHSVAESESESESEKDSD